MATILVVTASPRGDRSVSRALVTLFTELWAEQHPDDMILLRDVGHHPVPHVTEPWIVGSFAPPDAQTAESKAAIAVSDQLVDEFLAADRYVFGVPMYNFNIPSTFKAYIDQLVRPGRTFAVGPNGGSYHSGTPMASLNFQEPYLRTIFGFMGITDLQFIAAENMNQGEDAARQSREKAESAIKELAASW